jgi:hypothetical protein
MERLELERLELEWPWSSSPFGGRILRSLEGANVPFPNMDHDQARREDREDELAMPRTELIAYSQTGTIALTLR